MIVLGPSLKPIHQLRSQTVGIGGITASVRTDLEDVAADFASLYRGSPRPEPIEPATIRMEVRRVRMRLPFGDRYRIFGDGEEMGKPRRREEVLPFLEWGINWRVITTRCDYLQLHAACLVYRKSGGVLLAGGSGSGKSILSAALLARGWRFCTDELTLINPQTGYVHPFPKPICIKAGAFDIVERLKLPFAGGRHYVKGIKGRVGYINPYDIEHGTVAPSGPVRFVLFPKYTQSGQPGLFPISRARAVYHLVGGTLNGNAFGDNGIAVLSSLCAGTECFRLETGPIEETCDMLESLIDARS